MKRALPPLLLLALIVAVAGAASAAIDPFYRSRMEAGVRAFDQGNWETAARQLRIACFGHLDEPVALAECLVRLAVVDARLGDEDSFRKIFTRLVDLERRFSAYGAARVPAAVQQQFNELATRLVPPQDLALADGFEALAERAEAERIASLPPAQRRADLEARLQAEPDRPEWLIEMARLELAVRRPRPALDWLDRLTAPDAALPPAICLRQQAASEIGDCGRVHLSTPFCQDVPPNVVEFRLECLVDLERWPEAAGLLHGLDPDLRARRRVARLERKVRNQLGEDEFASAQAEVAAPAAPPAPAAARPTTAVAQAAVQDVERLRRRLAAATTRGELDALMDEAESLAELNPTSRRALLLAAEIAYLRSDWPRAVDHFRQAGALRADEAHLAFYQAVALFENGDPTAAAQVLRPFVARLERSRFVEDYLQRILAPGI